MTKPTININIEDISSGSKIPLLNVDGQQNLSEGVFDTASESYETLQFDRSKLNISTYSFSGIKIVIFEGRIYQEVKIPIQDNSEYLSLAFVKSGTITTKSKRCSFEHIAKARTANLCCHCHFEGTASFSPTEHLQIVSICFPKGYLSEFDTLITQCNSYKAYGYMHIPMVNNLPMQECVDMLLNPPITDNVKQVFLKGKAYELISLSIQSMYTQPISTCGVSDKERHRAYQARDILEESLLNPPKLRTLAHLVGTNDCKLKKDFKTVFNTSPYAYVIRRRMEKAYQHIITSDMAITTIAQNLGYNNASHFSSTFYKHYGVKPRDLKHLRKRN